MLPKLKRFILMGLESKMDIIGAKVEVFDIVSLCAEQKVMRDRLR